MIQASRTPKIIVSYRRSESGTAGRIFDRLVAHFGASSVFIDVDNIPYGVDFRKHIGEALEASDLLLAIVGNGWLGPIADGKYRIAEESDPVRVEIEAALERDISLLPVLVDDAKMPAVDALPDSIKEFAYRNAAEVESGRDFHFHVDRLIRSIDEILAGKLGSVPSEAAAANASTAKGFRRIFALRNLVLGLAALAVAALVAVVFSEGGRLSLESGDSTYALEASRSSGQPTFDLALTAWNAAKDTESVSVLEAFIARFGDSFYATLAKAKLAELKNEEEKTEVAVGVFPKPETTQSRNWNDCVGNNPDHSIRGCTAIIKLGEMSPRKLSIAYYKRGNAYEKKGQYDRIIADLDKAIEINPQYVDAYNSRGWAYSQKGKVDRAIADYDKAIEIDPQYALAYLNRGIAYDKKGQIDRTIADLDKAIEINPQYADAYNGRGWAYTKMGKVDRAIVDYDKAIEINPQDALAYNNRGFAYYKKGEIDRAIADYTKALEIDPSQQFAIDNLKNMGVTP